MRRLLIILTLLLLGPAPQPRADEPPPSSFANANRWYAEFLVHGLADVTNRHVDMGGASFGIGYYVRPNLALNADVSGYRFDNGRDNGGAVGLTLGLRHHILKIGNASLFMDVAGGIIEASANLPRHGTHFNNTFDFGPGIALPLKDNVSLIVGARYFHISNASAQGSNRNPSVNAIQGVIGLTFRF